MTHTKKAARLAIVLGATAALLSIGGGSVLAGEITGNGTLKEVHGRSACAYSGQEDLQWFTDDFQTERKAVPTKGDPAHAQSWGQIDKATRALLTSMGHNPGIACNPNKSAGEP
jgi:hypothetical protein